MFYLVVVLVGGRWDGGRVNKFLMAVRSLGLLQFFILIEFFENSTILIISIPLFIALKR